MAFFVVVCRWHVDLTAFGALGAANFQTTVTEDTCWPTSAVSIVIDEHGAGLLYSVALGGQNSALLAHAHRASPETKTCTRYYCLVLLSVCTHAFFWMQKGPNAGTSCADNLPHYLQF